MEKTVDVQYESGMRLVATTGSGHDVALDDVDGDTAPRPTEVLLAALGACTAMDIISIMAKKRQVYESYVVRIHGVQRDAYPQVYTRIDIVHEVVGAEVEVAQLRRCIELSANKYCPINAMLSAGETEVHHRFRLLRSVANATPEEGEVVVTGPLWRPEAILR